VFSVAEMTESGWSFIDGDCWGAVTVIDKISERPDEDKTKDLGVSSEINRSQLFISFARFVENYGEKKSETSYEDMLKQWEKQRNI